MSENKLHSTVHEPEAQQLMDRTREHLRAHPERWQAKFPGRVIGIGWER